MNHTLPLASLSLDLDNKWSYMKTHGDAGWEQFPSYFDRLIPRTLGLLRQHDLKITFFVVGQDAVLPQNANALGQIAAAGHEIGNHSFRHEPWLHLYSDEEIASELQKAHEAIVRVTGFSPVGFRGPGFSFSEATLLTLKRMGYRYDASTFPTYLGPLARLYYFMKSSLSKQELATRKALFGRLSDGLRPNRPYRWRLNTGDLLEIPVTTMPVFKIPIHASYVLYLSCYSDMLARTYLRTALALCRITGTTPSILLHPLDFLGCEDERDLAFFPAMNLPAERKLAVLDDLISTMRRHYRVVTLGEQASALSGEHLRQIAPARLITATAAPRATAILG